MALVHVHIRHHTPKQHGGSGSRAVRYLERTHEFDPEGAMVAGYNQRTSQRTKDYGDLVAKGTANLPSWAEGDPERFFETAHQKEGTNRRWATSMQANFPRQFSETQQVALVKDWVATALPNRPTLWVIHAPLASDQQPQPHTHLLWSERLQNDGKPERTPDVMFRRPEVGGCVKYSMGDKGDRQAIYRMREAWCAAVNVVVEREGLGEAALMDPRSFHTRGIERKPMRYGFDPKDPAQLEHLPLKDERTPETRAAENRMAREWWDGYKRSMEIDTRTMPQRDTIHLIAREVREPGSRAEELARERSRGPIAPTREMLLDQPLIGNVRSKIYHTPGDPNYGDVAPRQQVLFASTAAAEEAGYRAAKNQHYGTGATERMRAQARHLGAEIHQLEAHRLQVHAEQMREQDYHRTRTRRSPAAEHQVEAVLAQGQALGLGDDTPSEGLQVGLEQRRKRGMSR